MKKMVTTVFLLSILFNLFGQVKDSNDDGRKIRIPVVFHVLYSNNTENINDSLIINELNDANLDFTAHNDMTVLDNDFKNLIGNPNMEFYLLDTMLQDKGIKGVQRISSNSNMDPKKLLINSISCLNVFTANQGNASDILSDRINLYYDDVGKHNHVLTHETGHWLGLYHIWGKIGNCSKIKLLFGSHDDEIDDTPTQWTCTDLTYSTDCPPKKNLYYKGHKILYNNFMDYNACRCMFTMQQSIRMRNNIIEHKSSLFNRN